MRTNDPNPASTTFAGYPKSGEIIQWRVKLMVTDVFTGRLVRRATEVPTDIAWTDIPEDMPRRRQHARQVLDGKASDGVFEYRLVDPSKLRCFKCLNRPPLVVLKKGQSIQTRNGFFTASLKRLRICPECGGCY